MVDSEQLKAEKEAENIIDMVKGKTMDQSTLQDIQVTDQESKVHTSPIEQQMHDKFEAEFASKLSKEKAKLMSKYSKSTSEKQKLGINLTLKFLRDSICSKREH